MEHICDESRPVAIEAYISLTSLFQRKDLNKFLVPFIDKCLASVFSNLQKNAMIVQSKELFLAIGEVKSYESLAEKLLLALNNELNSQVTSV